MLRITTLPGLRPHSPRCWVAQALRTSGALEVFAIYIAAQLTAAFLACSIFALVSGARPLGVGPGGCGWSGLLASA